MDLKDIKRILEEKGISQSELARRTGYNRTYLNKVINGKVDLTEAFIYKFNEATSTVNTQILQKEKEEYARQVAELEARVDQLEKDLENADLDNKEVKQKLIKAYDTVQALLDKYGITDPD